MPTPAQIKATEEQSAAAQVLAYIESLERCEGFKKWLAPRIFKAYDSAAVAILDAHAQGRTPDASAIATYHGLHEIVTSCRRDKTNATHKLKNHI